MTIAFSNPEVTDGLDRSSFGGLKAIFEWAQERMEREEMEPVMGGGHRSCNGLIHPS